MKYLRLGCETKFDSLKNEDIRQKFNQEPIVEKIEKRQGWFEGTEKLLKDEKRIRKLLERTRKYRLSDRIFEWQLS